MAVASTRRFEEMITCVICQEVYQDPVALSCLHTLCSKCVDNLKKFPKKYQTVECPLCRDLTHITAIKKDFRTKNLVDILLREGGINNMCSSLCQLCLKRDIICKCCDCDKFMCSDCQQSHLAIPLCTDHIIKPLHTLIEEGHQYSQQILTKVNEDKQHYDNRLQQLCQQSDHIEDINKQINHDLERSQNYWHQLITTYHDKLRSEIDDLLTKERDVLTDERADIIGRICKLDQTSTQVLQLTAKSENSAIIAAGLQCLHQVELPQVTPTIDKTGSEFSIKLCHSSVDMESVLKLSVHRSENAASSYIQDNQRLGETANPYIHDKQRSGSLESKNDMNTTKPCVSMATKHQKSDPLRYCDEVSSLIDSIDNEFNIGECDVSESLDSISQPIESLCQLYQLPLTHKKDILLDKLYCPQKLCLINSEIWCLYKDKVHIYDIITCQLLRIFKHRKLHTARSVCKAHNGDCWFASEHGLLVLGPTYLYQGQLTGTFSDVTTYEENVYALQHHAIIVIKSEVRSGQVRSGQMRSGRTSRIKSSCSSEVISDHGSRTWIWKIEVTIPRSDNASCDDTIQVSGDTIYVCSYRGDCITVYNSLTGTMVQVTGKSGKGIGELWRPRLCCVDSQGTLLVADFYNNRLQVLDKDLNWRIVDIQGLNFPWDGVLDSTCGLLVLQQCNISHKILQFVATQLYV